MKCDYKPANFKQNDDKGHRYIPPFYRRPPRLLPVPIAFNQCLPRRARPRRSILEGSKNRGRERGSPSLPSPSLPSPSLPSPSLPSPSLRRRNGGSHHRSMPIGRDRLRQYFFLAEIPYRPEAPDQTTRRFEIEIPRQVISTILAVGPQIKCCIQKKDFIKIAHHSILNIFGPDLQNSPGSLLLGIPTVALPHAQCRSADKILILFTVKCIEFLGWSESRKLGIIPTCRPGRKSIGEVAWVARSSATPQSRYILILDFCRSLYVHSIEFDIPVQIRNVILKGNGKLSGKMMFSAGDMDVALFERSQNKKF